MADQKNCDFCKEIITSKIYYLSITEADLPKLQNKLLEFVTMEKALSIIQKKNNDYQKNTKHYEICKNCKKVIDYLEIMRIENLKILKNEVNGILNLPYKKDDNDKKD